MCRSVNVYSFVRMNVPINTHRTMKRMTTMTSKRKKKKKGKIGKVTRKLITENRVYIFLANEYLRLRFSQRKSNNILSAVVGPQIQMMFFNAVEATAAGNKQQLKYQFKEINIFSTNTLQSDTRTFTHSDSFKQHKNGI